MFPVDMAGFAVNIKHFKKVKKKPISYFTIVYNAMLVYDGTSYLIFKSRRQSRFMNVMCILYEKIPQSGSL